MPEPSLGELPGCPGPFPSLPCPPIPPHLWHQRSRCSCGHTDSGRAERVPGGGRGLKSSPLNWHGRLKRTLGYGLALVTRYSSCAYGSAFQRLGLGPLPPHTQPPAKSRHQFKSPSKSRKLCGVFYPAAEAALGRNAGAGGHRDFPQAAGGVRSRRPPAATPARRPGAVPAEAAAPRALPGAARAGP